MKLLIIIIAFLTWGINCIGRTIKNPVFEKSDVPFFHIDSIGVTPDSTIVYCTFRVDDNSWTNISPNTSIEIVSTGEKFNIINTKGVPFSPNKRIHKYAECCSVILSFPPIHNLGKLNLIEDSNNVAFNVYGISLKEENEQEYVKYGFHQLDLLNKKSEFFYSAKNYNKAIYYETQVMKICKALFGCKSSDYIISLNNLSQYYAYNKVYDKAIKYGEEAIEAIGNVTPEYSALLSNLGVSYAGIDDYVNAIKYFKQAWELCKSDHLQKMETMQTDDKYLYLQMQNINHLLGEYMFFLTKVKNKASMSDLYNLVLQYKGIVTKSGISKNCTWKQIQENLRDDEIAIEFISPTNFVNDTTEVFYALTIRSEYDAPHLIELFDVQQFEDSMMVATSQADKDFKIGTMIWRNLEKEMKNAHNVYFSPTNILNIIGIEYLPYNNSIDSGDIYNFYRVSSTKLLTEANNPPKYRKAVLYGGLTYNETGTLSPRGKNRSGFEVLYNTSNEVSEISRCLKNNDIDFRLYVDEMGTEKSFRSLSNQEIDIIHISSHGGYIKAEMIDSEIKNNNLSFLEKDENGMSFYQDKALSHSFFVLSKGNRLPQRLDVDSNEDGIITALDVSKMNLQKVDLVVLSACNTALGEYGEDDSILGFLKGFKIAGVNTLLLSLRNVDDEATRIMMVEFYKNLMSGKTKHQSLKDAQKYLRKVKKGKYNDPKYWASFIMLDGLN